jgi:hypothetical protein
VIRPFHYLRVVTAAGGLRVQVKGFDEADPELRVLDAWSVPYARSGS